MFESCRRKDATNPNAATRPRGRTVARKRDATTNRRPTRAPDTAGFYQPRIVEPTRPAPALCVTLAPPFPMRSRMRFSVLAVALVVSAGLTAAPSVQDKGGEEETGPYDVVEKWPVPVAKPGYIWGSHA